MKYQYSAALLVACFVDSAWGVIFNSGDAGSNNFKELVFKNRFFLPYGPDLTASPIQPSDGTIWEGYGFGMGAAEHAGYDHVEGYMYVQSEEGPYISVTDWSSSDPKLTPYSLDLSEYDKSDLKDVVVCPEKGYVFIAAVDVDKVLQYSTVKRDNPGKPTLIREIDAGPEPDNLRASPDCKYLAVANANDGGSFASGSVHLVSGFDSNSGPTVTKVSLDVFNDEELLAANVAMPLSLKAMEYWDDRSHIAEDLDLAAMRENYKPSYFFMPEFMKFSSDNKKLFVNLQDNSALVQIDVATNTVSRIDGYGLKPYKDIGVDLINDGGCSEYVSSDVLYAMRLPDAIDNLELDGVTYIFTADEGTDFDFDEYEEKYEAGDIFDGGNILLKGFTAPESFLNAVSPETSPTARFNKQCETFGTFSECLDGVDITVGSMAVDYSNSSAPSMDKIVLFGGRGMSIYKVPETGPIEFVWDSGDDFEKEGCAAFPWAHNGVQDEDNAPLDGPRYILKEDEREGLEEMNDPTQDGCEDDGTGNPGACPISQTIDDKSPERGMEPEIVTVAVACDRVLVVSCGENNGDCFLYDVTDLPSPPVLKQVLNLSPVSETVAPGPAYTARTLGDLDPEATFFAPAAKSPTGKDGIFFGGAHSGTMSWWEFECETPVAAVERVFGSGTTGGAASSTSGSTSGSSSENADTGGGGGGGMSGGAIGGLVLGGIAVAGIFAYFIYQSKKEPEQIILDGSKTQVDNSA